MLLLKADENLSERGRYRLAGVFSADDPTGRLQAAWQVKEQLRTLLNTSSLEDADAAKNALADLVARAAMPETNRLYRTVCRWWAETEGPEVLIVTGATTAKVEAHNTAIKHIERTARGYRNPDNYKSRILLRSAARMAA
jgi:transposase